MAFKVVKKQDWIVTGPDGQPVSGLQVTLQDTETGENFNVEVPGKTEALVKQYVQAAVDEHKKITGMEFE